MDWKLEGVRGSSDGAGVELSKAPQICSQGRDFLCDVTRIIYSLRFPLLSPLLADALPETPEPESSIPDLPEPQRERPAPAALGPQGLEGQQGPPAPREALPRPQLPLAWYGPVCTPATTTSWSNPPMCLPTVCQYDKVLPAFASVWSGLLSSHSLCLPPPYVSTCYSPPLQPTSLP